MRYHPLDLVHGNEGARHGLRNGQGHDFLLKDVVGELVVGDDDGLGSGIGQPRFYDLAVNQAVVYTNEKHGGHPTF